MAGLKPLRVRPDFSIEIHPDSLDALRGLAAGAETAAEMRDFVRAEAEDLLCAYLESNGINLRRIRSAYGEIDGRWAWEN